MSVDAPAYCAYFCEENIWHLCAHPRVAGCERRVVFISNRARRVAVWGQRLSRDPELPIAWDYHVVLLFRAPGESWKLWDLDAHTPEPQDARVWLHGSFRGAGVIPSEFLPRFRLIQAADYRRHLRSDRRHMRDAEGAEREPHPRWALVCGEPLPRPPGQDLGGAGAQGPHNLDRWWDTQDTRFIGELFDLDELRTYLAQTEAGARA